MSDKKPLIYLASPYSYAKVILRDPLDRVRKREVEQLRFEDVCRFAAKLFAKGYLVFSPIAHTHPIKTISNLPGNFAFYAEYDKRLIDACDEVWVLRLFDWEDSKGIYSEIKYAEQTGKPVRYVDEDQEEF